MRMRMRERERERMRQRERMRMRMRMRMRSHESRLERIGKKYVRRRIRRHGQSILIRCLCHL